VIWVSMHMTTACRVDATSRSSPAGKERSLFKIRRWEQA
jgi:hypothetical protein